MSFGEYGKLIAYPDPEVPKSKATTSDTLVFRFGGIITAKAMLCKRKSDFTWNCAMSTSIKLRAVARYTLSE